MNLFRSEEHVRRWAEFNPESVDGIKPVRAAAVALGGPLNSERLEYGYVGKIQERLPEMLAALDRMGGGSSFWRMPAPSA
jgi:hypothetical protein